jgi:hypothetical protein
MTSRWRRLACALVVLTCGLAAPALAQETPAAEPAAEKPAPIQPISIESVPKRAQALSTNLGELTPTEASRSELDDLGAQLVRSRAAVDARLQQILASLESGPGVRALGPMESELLALQSELDSHSETLDKLLADVGAKIKQLDTAQGVWQATLALAQGEKASRTTLQLVRKTQTDIGKTRAALVGRRDEILSLADGLIQERASIVGGVKRVQTARDTRRKDLLAVNRPPIFSTRAFEARRRELASDWSQATADRRERVFRYARENAGVIGFQLVLLLGLALGMYVLRRGARSWAQEDYDLRGPEQVLEMPISMALVITLALTPQLHPLAPALLTDLAYIFLVIPAARIVRRISPDVFAPLIVGLVVFYVVEQVREVLAVFPAIERVAFVAELAGAIVFLLWLIRPSKVAAVPRELLSQPVFRAVGMGVRVAIGLFAVALIAEMVGLSDLGDLVGGGAMAAALAGLFVYALLNVVRSLSDRDVAAEQGAWTDPAAAPRPPKSRPDGELGRARLLGLSVARGVRPGRNRDQRGHGNPERAPHAWRPLDFARRRGPVRPRGLALVRPRTTAELRAERRCVSPHSYGARRALCDLEPGPLHGALLRVHRRAGRRGLRAVEADHHRGWPGRGHRLRPAEHLQQLHLGTHPAVRAPVSGRGCAADSGGVG